jgi:hypothetical protein
MTAAALNGLYTLALPATAVVSFIAHDPLLTLLSTVPAVYFLFTVPVLPGAVACVTSIAHVLAEHNLGMQISTKQYVGLTASGLAAFFRTLLQAVVAVEAFTLARSGVSAERLFNYTSIVPAVVLLLALPLVEEGRLPNLVRNAGRVGSTLMGLFRGLTHALAGVAGYATEAITTDRSKLILPAVIIALYLAFSMIPDRKDIRKTVREIMGMNTGGSGA